MNASLFLSGGPLLSLLCSAWVRHWRRLLVEVVNWCASRLAKLICSRIIWMASSPGSCWPAVHLPTVSETYLLCLQVEWGQAPLVGLGLYGGSDLLGMFPLFLKRTADVLAPRLSEVFRRLVRLEFPGLLVDQKVHRPPLLPTTDRFP